MTRTLDSPAQRLAAHPRFRWECGMLDDYDRRDVKVFDDIWLLDATLSADDPQYDLKVCRRGSPVLSDPATTGVLLSWLPEATVLLGYDGDPTVEMGGTAYSGATLGEACAEAWLSTVTDG